MKKFKFKNKVQLIKSFIILFIIFLFNLPILTILNIDYKNLFIFPDGSPYSVIAQTSSTSSSSSSSSGSLDIFSCAKTFLRDWNGDGKLDLFAIKKQNTGSSSTEVHIVNGADNFQSFLLQTGTILHETGDNFDFSLGDWNGDGKLDLFAIKKQNTGSSSTEVHIVNGVDNFQSFLLQTGTILPNAGDNFDFSLGDWNGDGKLDLFAIKKLSIIKSTEVHIINGADNFQSFLLQTGTILPNAGDNFDFSLGDWNGDAELDLFAIKKQNTGSSSTEVHIVNGVDNFQSFLLQTGTALPETGDNFDFDVGDWNTDTKLDLCTIKKQNTGTNSTEVHIVNGADNFQSFLLQTGTILHEIICSSSSSSSSSSGSTSTSTSSSSSSGSSSSSSSGSSSSSSSGSTSTSTSSSSSSGSTSSGSSGDTCLNCSTNADCTLGNICLSGKCTTLSWNWAAHTPTRQVFVASSLAYNNKMWLIGGAQHSKVFYSTDGSTWNEAGTNSLGKERSEHSSVVFNGKMWVIGGVTGDQDQPFDSSSVSNEILSSTDGINWQLVGTLPVTVYAHSSVVYDNKMWVIGGLTSPNSGNNKILYSSDGITWKEAGTNSLPAAGLAWSSVVNFNGKMWIIGGQGGTGDGNGSKGVFSSTDGINWVNEGDVLPVATDSHSSVVFGDKVWVLGDAGSNPQVVYSNDGINWVETTQLPLYGFEHATAVVYNDKIWAIGGVELIQFESQVYSSTFSCPTPTATPSPTPPPNPPHVSGLTPNRGYAGKLVLIAGGNFIGFNGPTVNFGGSSATVALVTSTTIQAIPPAGSGTVDVTVITADGTSINTSSDNFSYVPPPKITKITPTSGTGGTKCVIEGQNFYNYYGLKINFGSTVQTTGLTVNSSEISISGVTVPTGCTGSQSVTVETGGGKSNPITFSCGGAILIDN